MTNKSMHKWEGNCEPERVRVQWIQKLAKLTGEVVISVRSGEAVGDGRRKGGEEAMGCTGAGEKKNSELLLKLPL